MLLFRAQDHDHLAPLQLGPLLDDAHFLQVRLDALEELHSKLLVRHLPPPEPQRHLGLVALGEEAGEVAHLDLVVALVGTRPELHFLHLDLLLLELRLVRLLALAVFELAVIHQTAHRRLRHRRDLDEIDVSLFREAHRFLDGHDAERLVLDSYEAHLRAIDLAVDANCFILSYAKIPLNINDLARRARSEWDPVPGPRGPLSCFICAPRLRPSGAK